MKFKRVSELGKYLLLGLALISMAVVLFGCGQSGSTGAPGSAGSPGSPGSSGAGGGVGPAGSELTVKITDKMGQAVLQQTGEFADGNKVIVNVAITGATADASGVVTVNFDVKNGTTPVTTISSISAGIFKLVPPGGNLNYNKWVPYIWRAETVSGTADAAGNPFVNPPGTQVNQGYRESSSAGTLVNLGGGSYRYTFGKNLTTATMPVGGTAIAYERNLAHRVSVYMGGHSGPTGEADFDFMPDGSAVTQSRNIVKTETCQKCHGPQFAGHGGDRVTVEGCVTCHSPDSKDAQSNESIEMAVMIHKIHAGNELKSVAGPDGQYYDNPNTPADETADNGSYAIWGNGVRRVSWEGAAFPAVLANCQACHTGTGLQNVDNWKTVPSRAACGSCHDHINWTTGANHAGGPRTNDNDCRVCHFSSGVSFGKSVTAAHDWTAKDIRNIPEFDITLTTDTPSRGYYIKGEKPVVSIALKDHFTGAVIVPATVVEDPAAEGCIPMVGSEGTSCTVLRDGLFRSANVYVTGPRAEKAPVLTYAARATVRSANVGPWNLSAGGGKLTVKVDSGMPMLWYDASTGPGHGGGYGADYNITGNITVTLPAAGAALEALFPSGGSVAAQPAEVAAWLNADATFQKRAIAYVDEALAGNANAGKLAIRSRGISKMNITGEVIETTPQRNIQLVAMPEPTMFAAADTAPATTSWKTAGGADSLRMMATANATNPKGDFTDPTKIKYTLDPVDDLVPGTYIIHVEFADAGRGATSTDYRTPSVTVATFQVKQAATEKPVAGNCTACHWSSGGAGFVLDYPRHNKIFDEKATDRCGGCHDYSSGEKPDAATQLTYAGSLSNRVHAVHNGSRLNYPTITVGHEETSAFGRNWRITYPMDIRNCESCHSEATTSGTWKTNPNRLACMGCHDSDSATAHMKIQTYDPTPLAPWSGDEQESCKSCH